MPSLADFFRQLAQQQQDPSSQPVEAPPQRDYWSTFQPAPAQQPPAEQALPIGQFGAGVPMYGPATPPAQTSSADDVSQMLSQLGTGIAGRRPAAPQPQPGPSETSAAPAVLGALGNFGQNLHRGAPTGYDQEAELKKLQADFAKFHRPPATPEVLQKLLTEGRISLQEYNSGQVPLWNESRMQGFLAP